MTLAGETVVGRAGLSLAHNLGLLELVADRPERFVAIAVELAHDGPRLSALRHTLRARLQASPLMDKERFTRALEEAYRQAWRYLWARNA